MTALTQERIKIIDVLRGVTLLGIVIVHMIEQYYGGGKPQMGNPDDKNLIDSIVEGISFVIIFGKFYLIFAFLFGLSFSIQLVRAKGAKTEFITRFLWRLTVLFGIGFIHHLHYRGDILTIFSVIGIFLLLFNQFSDRFLLIFALFFAFNIPSLIFNVGKEISEPPRTQQREGRPPESDDYMKNELEYYEIAKNGTYTQILTANANSLFSKYEFQISSGRVFMTLGMFLLGLFVGRKKYFENLLENLPFFKKIFKYSGFSLLFLYVLAIILLIIFHFSQNLPPPALFPIFSFFFDVSCLITAFTYVSGFVILFQKPKFETFFMNFYWVGRMGLTTYVTQSFVAFFIFFGVGLGLLDEIGAAFCALMGILLFVLQIIFAKFWFKYFRYGLLEWLWRSLTYFSVQPLKK